MNPRSDGELSTRCAPLFSTQRETGTHVLVAQPLREVSALRFVPLGGFVVGEDDDVRPLPDTTSADRVQAVRAMIDAAREEAAVSTRRELEQETEARVRTERARMIEVCERFARDRQRYFAAAEEQVVRLALAIAARVLHKEAQVDPLVLTRTVRAALSRVQDGSASILRVPPEEVAKWAAVFVPGSEPTVQVLADERMTEGQCVLETVVGRVDLGIEVQLAEIARGFAELVQVHPEQRDVSRE